MFVFDHELLLGKVHKDDFQEVTCPIELFVEHEVLPLALFFVVLKVESNQIMNFYLSRKRR
jgi:hypothetical protein